MNPGFQQQPVTHRTQWLRFACLAVLACGIAVAITACGFKLRGSRQLPPEMSVIYLRTDDPHGALAGHLRRQIQASRARVTGQPENATAILEILHDRADRRVLSVGTTGKAREFELHHAVAFRVLQADGKELIPRQEVSLTRDFVFDETDVLGKANEEDLVRREIVQDLVRLILLRLEAGASR